MSPQSQGLIVRARRPALRSAASLLGVLLLAALPSSPAVAADLPDILEPLRTGQKAPNDAAVVIGLERYAFIAGVPHATRDADAVYEFLVYTRGVPGDRVRLLKSGDRASIERAVAEAGRSVGPKGTVWVYFAGHGIGHPETKERLLLGDVVRSSVDSIADRGVSVARLTQLAGAGGGRVHLMIDACYAGAGRDGSEILGGKRVLVPAYALQSRGNVLEWSAAGPGQLSGPMPGARHGAFTYLAIGALRGWADGEVDGQRDGVVTAEEAHRYVNRMLRRMSLNDQESQLVGVEAGSVSLATSVREKGPELREAPRSAVGPGSSVEVIGGGSADYAALVAAREAQRRQQEELDQQQRQAREALERQTRETEAKLAAERRSRLDAATAELRARATRDYQAIEPLMRSPSKADAPILERWLADYAEAKVRIDGVEERIEVAEVGVVRAAVQEVKGAAGGGDRWVSKTTGMELVRIPAGTFTMGCTRGQLGQCDVDEKPSREVKVSRAYYLGVTEVTQAQWRVVMGSNPSYFSSCGETCPVENVSWLDAAAYANKLSERDGLTRCYAISGDRVKWSDRQCTGYRLPTEAEWERATRAGEDRLYAGSDELKTVAWTSANSGGTTRPKSQLRANGFELHDMSGNVWEWTWDWYGAYNSRSAVDPMGLSSSHYRVIRGGSWIDTFQAARVANRGRSAPSNRDPNLGLRLARSAP